MARWQRYEEDRARREADGERRRAEAQAEAVELHALGLDAAGEPDPAWQAGRGMRRLLGSVLRIGGTLTVGFVVLAAVAGPVCGPTAGASAGDFRDPRHGKPVLMQLRGATIVPAAGGPVVPAAAVTPGSPTPGGR